MENEKIEGRESCGLRHSTTGRNR